MAVAPPDTPVVAAQGVVHPVHATASPEARNTADSTPSGSRREPKDKRSKVKFSKRKTSQSRPLLLCILGGGCKGALLLDC